MGAKKISISLQEQDIRFVDSYSKKNHVSRSAAIKEGLHLLQQAQLEKYYGEANNNIDDAFEAINSDGLENETW